MSRVVFTDTVRETLSAYLRDASHTSIFILADENTALHCLPLIKDIFPVKLHSLILIPQGEESKSLDSCRHIWSELLQKGADRNSLLLNLGGGMITDIGGFAAATFKRGIDFIHIPTSLLGMLDAAIGGKTAINLGNEKNQIGVFAEPSVVFIDSIFLKTLPQRELLSGLAEAGKYGLIKDKTLWEQLRQTDLSGEMEYRHIIGRCVAIKQKVVEADPKEKGIRKILNYGHTIGHALESYSHEIEKPLLHGEAIAIGMVIEGILSVKKAGFSKKELEQIYRFQQRIVQADPDLLNTEKLTPYIRNDKKNLNQKIRCILLSSVGNALTDVSCTEDEIGEALEEYREWIA
jgi:3-dehydroquinate synthase